MDYKKASSFQQESETRKQNIALFDVSREREQWMTQTFHCFARHALEHIPLKF